MGQLTNYQDYISPIPEFLYKYLELDILQRLKGISFFCGMDYASKNIYDFKFYVSRYDHSLSVALIVWRLTHDKKATLAGLFHDVSTPVFSHVIDYMNGDYVNQESTEEYTEKILASSSKLQECLAEDGISLDEISDFKQYSVVDLDRPKMCADRLDGTLTAGMSWVKVVDLQSAIKVIGDTTITLNEDGEKEISFTNYDSAAYVSYVNDQINRMTHTKEDTYMMILLSRIVKRCLEIGLFSYDDLYVLQEDDIVRIIEENTDGDTVLGGLWSEFKTIKKVDQKMDVTVKQKTLRPLVGSFRLN